MSGRTFPFVPKSNKSLEPGDFWSIPLQSGRYACGRVIGRWPEGKGSRTGFLGGLLDWSSDAPPTEESIAGAVTVEQGGVHIKAILTTGGEIIGHRALELDDIDEWRFIETPDNKTPHLYRGLTPLRPATEEEQQRYPILPIFGYQYMEARANTLFGDGWSDDWD